MNSTDIKSKITRLIICSVITFIVTIPFHYLFQIIPVSELRPASALPPAFGLMFGPWGAVGAALGNLASDIIIGYPPEIYIISFFAQFLYGYIPYKLWYTLDIGENNSLPRLNTVQNLIKFVLIVFVSSFIMAGLLGFLMEGLGIANLISFTTLLFAVNNFDFTMILGTLIIIGASFYNISMYKPEKAKKVFVSPKIFDGMLIVAIIIGFIYSIYSIFAGPNIWGIAAGVIFYLLVAAYALKPVTKEMKKRVTEIKISLTEKLIVIFIIIGAIIAILAGIGSFFMTDIVSEDKSQFWRSVYLNITLILTIFYISSIGFLWYIERNITTPIESISHIAKNYVSDSGIDNINYIISKCQQYASHETEAGVLASSFQKMILDLEIYMKNLEKATAEKERINTELNIAKRIQADMLPKKFPAYPQRKEFDVYAMNIPAKKVGGDFYDFFLIDENHLAIVIADVSGKGVPAALFMVIAKTLIKNHAQLGKSPAEVFTTVNSQLYEGNDENMFVTAWMGILEIETGKFTYVNAGHNSPLLKHAGKDYNWLKSNPGFVLAGMENINYHQNEINLEPRDRIYLYTDGVTEAINHDEELFGDSRLLQVMNSENDPNLTELLSHVKEEIDIFAGNKEQFDDITMLIMEYKR